MNEWGVVIHTREERGQSKSWLWGIHQCNVVKWAKVGNPAKLWHSLRVKLE